MERTSKLKLVFHTAFKEEFSGESPKEIVDALYENSAKGMGNISFEEWWKYQQTMWGGKYGVKIPEPSETDAHEALLNVLTKVGALEIGPLVNIIGPKNNDGEPSVG